MNQIYTIESNISLKQRSALMAQTPCVIWFTGLSGSGKSTLSSMLELKLTEMGFKAFMLDGDNIRAGLNKDLSFSIEDRKENLRRIGEVSKLMVDAGLVVISAFISPLNEDRELVRKRIGAERFIEVYVECPVEVCEQRDIKGLYKKARNGEIKNFTGIDSPYERPENPDLVLQTHLLSISECLTKIMQLVEKKIKL